MDKSIFRAYDIRGIYPSQINESFAFDLARVLAEKFVNKGFKKIVVGWDARHSSDSLASHFVSGLLQGSEKLEVFVLGKVPTPYLYFASRKNEGLCPSGVMITASHNPGQYNGFKICINAHRLFGQEIKAIAELMEDLKTIESAKKNIIDLSQPNRINEPRIKFVDISNNYLCAAKKSLKINLPKSSSNQKKYKVVLDSGNGITGAFAPDVFCSFGFEVVELFCDLDADFPNHPPDSSRAENLVDLQKKVLETKADFGLAFDGDGDRLAVVDDKGKILWIDQLILLFALDIHKKSKSKVQIIHDVKCSNLISEILQPLGVNVIMSPTGHSLVSEKIQQTKADFAGEMSGHLFFNDRWGGFDDGIYSGLRIAELIISSGKKLSKLTKDFPIYSNTPEILVEFENDKKKFQFMNNFKKLFHQDSLDYELLTLDGIRLNFNPKFAIGWGLVRASNTSAALTIRFEAKDEQDLTKISQFFHTKITLIDERIGAEIKSQLYKNT